MIDPAPPELARSVGSSTLFSVNGTSQLSPKQHKTDIKYFKKSHEFLTFGRNYYTTFK